LGILQDNEPPRTGGPKLVQWRALAYP
jgi:hypothetical protein